MRPRGVLRQRDRRARTIRLSAVRPARQPDHFGGRPAHRGRFCAQAGGDRADRRADPGAGPRRSAARGDQGPLPFPAIDKVAAQCRPVGISARMAGGRRPRQKAISSSRSTSIRRAFCRRIALTVIASERSNPALPRARTGLLRSLRNDGGKSFANKKSLPSLATAGSCRCAGSSAAVRGRNAY